MQARALPVPAVQLITGRWNDLRDLRARVEAALAGGIRWIQLRARERSARDLYEAAVLVAPLLDVCGGLLVVNDRADVALAAGAGGVHLPEAGLAAADARRLLGREAWIARSVHSAEAVRALQDDDVDAVQFGPVFETASKRAYGEPQGLARLALAAGASTRAALVAVGGIDAERVAACRSVGASAVSVIGAVWDAADIEAAARSLVVAAGS